VRKVIALLFVVVWTLFSQQAVNQTAGSPPTAIEKLFYWTGTNLTYLCVAPSQNEKTTVTVSAVSNASPAVVTATAHNFGDFANLGATLTPSVCISGYTGNWVPFNGCWIATVTSANAFTIPVDTTTFGATTGTAVYTTETPRFNRPRWAITKFYYDGSNNLITQGWAVNPAGAGSSSLVGGSTGYSFACSSRASLGYN
jgi:hypothetical protein